MWRFEIQASAEKRRVIWTEIEVYFASLM